MTIFDHGIWATYAPEVWPADLPLGIAFCRRDGGGEDWYRYQLDGSLSHESVKMTCRLNAAGDWQVVAATVVGSSLFPAGCRLLELYDGNLDDPHLAYVGHLYDPESNTLVDPPPVVVVPTEASKLGLRRVFVERGVWDQVKAHIASDPEIQEEWDLATVIKRSDKFVQTMIALLNLQPADVDAIMVRQAQLV